MSVGEEIEFEGVIARLVELAYTRVDMVGRRGEFAVRGGILDVFPPTAEHPVRIEFWGDEVSEMRMFSVADQRSIPEIDVDTLIAVACRELLLTDDVRARAAELAATASAPPSPRSPAASPTCWPSWPRASRSTAWRRCCRCFGPDEHALLTDQLAERHTGPAVRPGEGAHPGRRPDQDRPRVPRGVVVGRRVGYGRAGRRRRSWAGRDSPNWTTCGPRRPAPGHPWWTLSQLSDESAVELDIRAAPSARGHQHDIDGIFAMLRAHVSTGGYAVVVAPGTGTAHRVVERLAESDTPAAMLESGAAPKAGVVGVLKGPLHDGVVMPGANLVVITETDLTGSRATAVEGKRLGGQAAQHR